MTDLLERTDEQTRTTNNDGDHDKYSHYVHKNDQLSSIVEGAPLVALCGKVWVPQEFDINPGKRTVCPECKKKYEALND